MNCALALRMLDACVDDELDVATAAEMTEHLAACAACAEAHERRLAMRSAVRGAALRDAAPSGLLKSIRRDIRRLESSSTTRPPRWWQALALAVSSAAVGALGGWWLALPHAQQMLPELAVARHVASLAPEGPRIDVASPDRHLVRPWFQGRLEFAPRVRDLSPQGFDLVGARLERLGDREAVAVVYRLHNHFINVFSWRRQGDATETPRESAVRGFNVIEWSDRDIGYAAVSDTDTAELKRFAAAYRAP